MSRTGVLTPPPSPRGRNPYRVPLRAPARRRDRIDDGKIAQDYAYHLDDVVAIQEAKLRQELLATHQKLTFAVLGPDGSVTYVDSLFQDSARQLHNSVQYQSAVICTQDADGLNRPYRPDPDGVNSYSIIISPTNDLRASRNHDALLKQLPIDPAHHQSVKFEQRNEYRFALEIPTEHGPYTDDPLRNLAEADRNLALSNGPLLLLNRGETPAEARIKHYHLVENDPILRQNNFLYHRQIAEEEQKEKILAAEKAKHPDSRLADELTTEHIDQILNGLVFYCRNGQWEAFRETLLNGNQTELEEFLRFNELRNVPLNPPIRLGRPFTEFKTLGEFFFDPDDKNKFRSNIGSVALNVIKEQVQSRYQEIKEKENPFYNFQPGIIKDKSGDAIDPNHDLAMIRGMIATDEINDHEKKEIEDVITKKLTSLRDIAFPPENPKFTETTKWIHDLRTSLESQLQLKIYQNTLNQRRLEMALATTDPAKTDVKQIMRNAKDGTQFGLDSVVGNSALSHLEGGDEVALRRAAMDSNRRFYPTPPSHAEVRIIENAQRKVDSALNTARKNTKHLVGGGKEALPEFKSFDDNDIFKRSGRGKAKDAFSNLGEQAINVLRTLGRGIVTGPKAASETDFWRKFRANMNAALLRKMPKLSPERAGAFELKLRAILENSLSNDNFITEEDFEAITSLLKQYMEEQHKGHEALLERYQEEVNNLNKEILEKAKNLSMSSAERTKYRMLQILLMFSPLAPLAVLNPISSMLGGLVDGTVGFNNFASSFLSKEKLGWLGSITETLRLNELVGTILNALPFGDFMDYIDQSEAFGPVLRPMLDMATGTLMASAITLGLTGKFIVDEVKLHEEYSNAETEANDKINTLTESFAKQVDDNETALINRFGKSAAKIKIDVYKNYVIAKRLFEDGTIFDDPQFKDQLARLKPALDDNPDTIKDKIHDLAGLVKVDPRLTDYDFKRSGIATREAYDERLRIDACFALAKQLGIDHGNLGREIDDLIKAKIIDPTSPAGLIEIIRLDFNKNIIGQKWSDYLRSLIGDDETNVAISSTLENDGSSPSVSSKKSGDTSLHADDTKTPPPLIAAPPIVAYHYTPEQLEILEKKCQNIVSRYKTREKSDADLILAELERKMAKDITLVRSDARSPGTPIVPSTHPTEFEVKKLATIGRGII